MTIPDLIEASWRLIRDLIVAWRLARHPQSAYLETAAVALTWPVPFPLIRDSVAIDTEVDKVVYILAAECPCGCGHQGYAMVPLEPGSSRFVVFTVLEVAALRCLDVLERAGAAGDETTEFRLPDELILGPEAN